MSDIMVIEGYAFRCEHAPDDNRQQPNDNLTWAMFTFDDLLEATPPHLYFQDRGIENRGDRMFWLVNRVAQYYGVTPQALMKAWGNYRHVPQSWRGDEVQS